MSYIDTIKEKARADKRTIVLPETNDKRTLIAASHIIEEGIANIIMVGNEEKIMDGAGWLEVDLSGVKVVDPNNCDKLDEYVELLYETRKHKGMTKEKAKQILLSDNLTFGVIVPLLLPGEKPAPIQQAPARPGIFSLLCSADNNGADTELPVCRILRQK